MKNLSKFALLCVVSMFGFNVVASEPAALPTVNEEIKKDDLNTENKDEKKEEIKK